MAERRTLERRIRRAFRDHLGFDEPQPGQLQAVRALLEGRDTLAVMPTGAGKSAIYQAAGALLRGATVVLSPLIALQRDQAESIRETSAGEARALNSSLAERDQVRVLDDLEAGRIEFLLLAPEQLVRSEVRERLARIRPSLFVVDEAHCISDWGHDFRPEYLQLPDAVEALGRPAIVGLTATAAPPVRAEIAERLRMRDPAVVVRGFDRPNIRLGVDTFTDEASKRRALVEHVGRAAEPGIVYAATRRRAEEIAELLRDAGIDAAAYHAGLRSAERHDVHEAFMEGRTPVVVATTAFGMGIDKPNVRFVFHADAPDSLDAYYQEFGRAGRDGQGAEARLFFRPEDLGLRRFFAASGQVDPAEVRRVAEVVHEHDAPLPAADLREEVDLSQTKLAAALGRLADTGLVELRPDGEVAPAGREPSERDLTRAAKAAVEADERHRALDESRIEMLRGYAETRECRRRYILNYFGEEAPARCGRCDTCESGISTAEEDEPRRPFELGATVRHRSFGDGQVVRYEGERVVVRFEQVGYKSLVAERARQRGILRAG
ncbi:MAG TPA: RecQ family ATP-dependent DNA helicase [Candidatus Limnocylindria bacterium]|nr:RecQ family ATP-dependent DNA helicase [Candidatus Limnocylindria bacterium]